MSVITVLEMVSDTIFKLFDDNEMQANGSNCHVLIKSTHQKVQVNIGTARIENSKSQKPLGVNIDSELNFNKHIKTFSYSYFR